MSSSQSSRTEPIFGASRQPLFGSPSGSAEGVSREEPAPVNQEGSLVGRLAVITGGSGLLGAAMAVELAERGADICLMGDDPVELRQTLQMLRTQTHSAMLRCDLSSESEVLSAADFIGRIGRPVDILVHAAGLQAPSTVATAAVAGLDEHYLWNLRGPYLLTQQLLADVVAAQGQVVFFVATETDPRQGSGGDVHHIISQAAVQAFAQELRTETTRLGVRVLVVDAVAQTWSDLSTEPARPSGRTVVESLAYSVVDTLSSSEMDVTELRVQRPSAPLRRERR
ncbi:MAG: SDR family oxidoreductase [Microthrixaceae bacterium]